MWSCGCSPGSERLRASIPSSDARSTRKGARAETRRHLSTWSGRWLSPATSSRYRTRLTGVAASQLRDSARSSEFSCTRAQPRHACSTSVVWRSAGVLGTGSRALRRSGGRMPSIAASGSVPGRRAGCPQAVFDGAIHPRMGASSPHDQYRTCTSRRRGGGARTPRTSS